VQKVICNPLDDVEKDRIKEVFSSLQQVGGRWCRWAELVGGYGAFFVHPPCLAMSMYTLLEQCRHDYTNQVPGLREI